MPAELNTAYEYKGQSLVGQKFGKLTVLRFAGVKQYRDSRQLRTLPCWHCECECGGNKIVESAALKNGQVSTCGCFSIAKRTEHGCAGAKKNPIYTCWGNMVARCCNPNHPSYRNYGGRGIKVCERWRTSFQAFQDDMGATWQPGLSIERVNNNGDYCPDNCIWATKVQQCRNHRDSWMVTYNGETKHILEWADTLKISYDCLRGRIEKLGWSVERAFTTPHIPRSSKL